jgi:hypothetical protein
MISKEDRRKYVPPQVLDLSNLAVDGTRPLGTCTTGKYPWNSCNYGDLLTGVTGCYAGDMYGVAPGSNCTGGNTPTGNACLATGSSATNTCSSGTFV